MKKSVLIIVAIIVSVVGLCSYTAICYAQNEPTGLVDNEEVGEIEWLSIEEAVLRQETEPRYWIIDVYTDWCGWCKRMDATTFKDPHVAEEIKKNFYAVKFDGEAKRDITIQGKTYKFVAQGNRGYHELAAVLLNGQMSYPSIAYMGNDGNLIQTIPGFKTAEDIHPILQYFGTGSYKSTAWDEFQKNYTSPYSK